MDELLPSHYLGRLIKLWWIVVICTLLGGTGGYLISRVKQPVYEAKAIFHVSIDLTLVPFRQQPLELHDEDLALASLHGAMLNPEVIQALFEAAQSQKINLNWDELIQNYTVERKNTLWELRYRSFDPQIAYTVVSIWAEKTYEKACALQIEQKIPRYVIFSPPLIPGPPSQPVYYHQLQLFLAGGGIGLLAGLFAVDLAAKQAKPNYA